MESGKIFGSNDHQDSRSCESGWTMYLASQSHDHYCYYDHDDEEDSDGGASMESDASSGPMEATSCLKVPQEVVDEQTSTKKKKKKKKTADVEEMVSVETTTRVHNINHDDDDDEDGDDNDDDGDNHDYDYGHNVNDNYSGVHNYVGSVRHEGFSFI